MFTLDQIVPLGRSLGEYQHMFALTEEDLSGRIVGCADGPASFNAEAFQRGYQLVSCDPLYHFDAEAIRCRIHATFDQVMEQTRLNRAQFVWDTIKSVDELARVRMAAMETFLADYEAGKRQGRYIEAALPALPFPDASFDLALCSHFLFLYTAQLSESFHRQAVVEMCRVAAEVRIFPLLTLGGEPSVHIDSVLEAARSGGLSACVERVPYEFQRGGNQMMRIARPEKHNWHVSAQV